MTTYLNIFEFVNAMYKHSPPYDGCTYTLFFDAFTNHILVNAIEHGYVEVIKKDEKRKEFSTVQIRFTEKGQQLYDLELL